MEWGKLYANLTSNPRVQAAEDSASAGWLLIESMCYLTSAETKGFIPHTQVERFGGGSKRKQRVLALVREQLWIPVEGGYLIDPELWTEERNLSDAAERKKEADRKRIAAKRAAAKAAQNGHVSRDMSRDSRATPDATSSGDSRNPEKRREETPVTDVVNHRQVPDARAMRDDDDRLVASVVSGVQRETGRSINRNDAIAAITVVRRRAEEAGTVIQNPLKYYPAAVAVEFGTLEPPPLTDILADFASVPSAAAASRHVYDHDPLTGTCRECDMPRSNQSRHREAS